MLASELPTIGLQIGVRGDIAGDGFSRRSRRGAKFLRRAFADLTITAASVVSSASTTKDGTAGEAITAGQAVYLKSSDGLLWKAQADGSAAEGAAVGIALNGGAAGQPIKYQYAGDITIGATVAVGILYCVSAAAGGICPSADLASSDYVTLLGIGKTAAIITMGLNAFGIEKA